MAALFYRTEIHHVETDHLQGLLTRLEGCLEALRMAVVQFESTSTAINASGRRLVSLSAVAATERCTEAMLCDRDELGLLFSRYKRGYDDVAAELARRGEVVTRGPASWGRATDGDERDVAGVARGI